MPPTDNSDQSNAREREILDAFDAVNGGVHAGFRPAHAKGIMLSGTFTPAAGATTLTRAPHLSRASTPVTVRFSDFAGIPSVPDNDPNASPRGFALRFHLEGDAYTDIIGHSVDAFPARTAEELAAFLRAVAASGPSGPKPPPIEAYLASHPAALEFVQAPKPFPSSFAKESFSLGECVQVHQRGGCGPLRSLPYPSRWCRRISFHRSSGGEVCQLPHG
jgi:catalase